MYIKQLFNVVFHRIFRSFYTYFLILNLSNVLSLKK